MFFKILRDGIFLVVQGLGLGAFTAVVPCSIPGQGTNIPQAAWPSQKTVCLNAKDRDHIFMKEKRMPFQAL